ncbi:T9SS type A sorting domain-containing protein [Rhodothermus bifroesti]|uniref:T9SS type A sorting domain-containing protein n=1 Tax=Rhodothermus marinus TaxID=29549 RepID=A0A7V2B049_RHOMR|nr:T9SS type A sorting domain-containing protein [Rhodothermus bifroesti]GBD02102.1 hypothetical protein HRbin18_01837 [bacterium HR18]
MGTLLRQAGRVIGLSLLCLGIGNWSAKGQQTLLDRLTADSPMNLLSDGGFELGVPSYWRAEGLGAEWTRERSRTPEWSLKLSGSGSSAWIQDEAVRNWTPRIAGNLELLVGGWVWTEGVNVNPQTEEEKFQLVFEFYNAQGQDLLGGPLVLDVPQQEASTNGWVRIDNASLGSLVLPEDAASVRIVFRKGSQATGVVYLDDVFVRKVDAGAPGWEGDFFNANMDVSGGWYYWWPDFPRGLEVWPEGQEFAVTVTGASVRSGQRALRIEDLQGTAQYEAVAISERVPVVAGEPVLVSFWVRYEGVGNPDSIGLGNYNIGLTALWYNQMESGAAGWGEIGGVDIRLNGDYNDQVIPLAERVDSSGWRQYAFVLYPKAGAVGMELRLRYWHAFTGTTYWDDVFIAPVSQVLAALPNLLSDGGFELGVPSYWRAEGLGAEWTRERSRTPEWSLKLSGSGSSAWIQDEAVRNWTPRIAGNLELLVGGWVWTEGVNVNPQTEEEKFQLVFEFYNAQGQDLLGGPLVLDVPQQEASTNGWVRIDNASLGSLVLPEDAASVRIVFRKGSQATGVVYLDDVFVRKVDAGAPGWEGDFFNANMDVSGGWYYWWPDFPRGLEVWPEGQEFAVTVTGASVRSGQRALRIEDLQGTAQYEAVAISERVPVVAGEPVLVSFWVRYEGVGNPDSIGLGNYNIGLTALWYNQMESGAAGWGEIGGVDIRLNGDYNDQVIPLAERVDSSGWRQYAFVLYPKAGAVGMELRLRYWHAFTGTTYWDDVSIVRIGGNVLTPTGIRQGSLGSRPERFLLHANYPNPFRNSTTLAFSLPQPTRVTLTVYNLLGQEVATLVQDALLEAGTHQVRFDARDLPAGLYLYQLRAGAYVETRTMLLVK